MMSRSAITLLATLLCVGPALAQDRPAADHKACAPGDRLQPGERGPQAPGGSATTGENLSDKLARTDGVICPPNVDPEIKAPTPEGGKMPVIPPPGAPGGDPSVRPK
jgi:hypothetical protein